MIEKILSEIEKLIKRNEESANACYPSAMARESAYYECKEIVQEVAKEYGNGWIPVETELPQEDGMYLCTVFHADSYIVWIMRFKNGEFLRPDDVEDLDYEVLAWQRIAPYQKGE